MHATVGQKKASLELTSRCQATDSTSCRASRGCPTNKGAALRSNASRERQDQSSQPERAAENPLGHGRDYVLVSIKQDPLHPKRITSDASKEPPETCAAICRHSHRAASRW